MECIKHNPRVRASIFFCFSFFFCCSLLDKLFILGVKNDNSLPVKWIIDGDSEFERRLIFLFVFILCVFLYFFYISGLWTLDFTVVSTLVSLFRYFAELVESSCWTFSISVSLYRSRGKYIILFVHCSTVYITNVDEINPLNSLNILIYENNIFYSSRLSS